MARRHAREVALLYGATLVVTVGLTLLQGVVGWLRGYLLVFVAATFLYLPIEVLHRKGEDSAAFGIHREEPWRHLRLALLVMLVTLAPYLVGFHFWQTEWLGRDAAPAEARFDRWPVELEDAPRVATMRPGEVRLYTVDERVWLEWHLPAGQRFEGRVDSDAPLVVVAGRRHTRDSGERQALTIRGRSDGRVGFRADGTTLTARLEAGGDRLPPKRLRLGTALVAADANPYTASRDYLWLLNLLLVQILLVALPEEVFYRGYLQTRLDSMFGRDVRVLGVMVNPWSLVLTSALFAIGHFLTIPSPARLAVFFPSLLFGWMRRASDGVMAPILYHAACNITVELAMRFYT